MFTKVAGIVAAGIDVKLVWYVPRGKDFVQRFGACIEAVIVLIATVEVDLQTGQTGGGRQSERTAAVPEGRIRRTTEDFAENAGTRRIGGGAKKRRKLFDQSSAVRADGNKELRMAKSQVQSAIAPHGNTGDGTMAVARGDAVAFFHKRKKLLEQEILVMRFSVFRIDVEAGVRAGSSDHKLLQLPFFPHVFCEIPRAGMNEELLVVAEAVKKVQDWKVPGLVHVKGWRKNNAIRNGAGKNLAGNGVALDAARRTVTAQRQSGKQQAQNYKMDFIHNEGRRQD